MAKKRRRRSGGMTIPLAPIIGLAAGMVGPVQQIMAGNTEAGLEQLCSKYTGWSMNENKWRFDLLQQGAVPLVAGLLVHKFVGGSPLNLNAILARAKVPLIRI